MAEGGVFDELMAHWKQLNVNCMCKCVAGTYSFLGLKVMLCQNIASSAWKRDAAAFEVLIMFAVGTLGLYDFTIYR